MMDPENLHLLIHEEIYVINENQVESSSKEERVSDITQESPKTELEHKIVEKIPVIPQKSEITENEKVVQVAVFHESINESELELLKKIIEACKLTPDQYEVFANGFNKEVKFKKALAFVASAKKFYEPIPYQESQILCSKPLNEIANNQQEKVQLWSALKEFL